MGLVCAPLTLIGVIWISPFLLLVLFIWAICYDLFKSELPPGIDQPLKLRFYHSLLVIAAVLGRILEKLGICSDISLLRFLLDGIPPQWRDSKLLIRDLKFAEVPVRVYQAKAPSVGQRRGVLYFHGGAGTLGSINAFERVCRYIARETDSVVVSVGYRLAPEYLYPSQYWDCLNATIHFMRNVEDYQVDPARIILCGDSCGANFATAICQILVSRTDLPKIRAQVLIYPGLQGLDFYLPSYQQNRAVPILFRDRVVYLCLRYLSKDTSVVEDVLKGSHVPEDMKLKYKKWISADNIPEEFKIRGYKPQKPPSYTYKHDVHEVVKQMLEVMFSPLLAEDAIVSQLPESYILTCEFDVLRDDGLLYKKRLEDNGVRVTWYHNEDGFHGVLTLFGYGIFSFPSAKKILDNTVNFIKKL
ncbi:arylacetamide deacetylase-like 4 [Gopherus flavomarginatus]|uniref:arylacetamide deacetylase-like 4 n=1 Tax=Gopherus flavomarginatus TaxID=286002 RepID=UPI0021CC04DB|nr:arylacetamide deacetylase-like 4 [Gopherus flavomarginatus]